MTSFVLVGGIKGWADAGAEYVACMDGYDKSVWAKEDPATTEAKTVA